MDVYGWGNGQTFLLAVCFCGLKKAKNRMLAMLLPSRAWYHDSHDSQGLEISAIAGRHIYLLRTASSSFVSITDHHTLHHV